MKKYLLSIPHDGPAASKMKSNNNNKKPLSLQKFAIGETGAQPHPHPSAITTPPFNNNVLS